MPAQVDLGVVQKALEWLKTKLYLNTQTISAQRRTVKRGQVYRCNFGVGVGSEMQKDRPAVIVQNDVGNKQSGNTIVLPITHDTSTLPCVASITPQYEADGVTLKLDGQANASNIMCISPVVFAIASSIALISLALSVPTYAPRRALLMSYYADVKKQLNDKLTYIERIKAERNEAQDTLVEICSLLGLGEAPDKEELLVILKKHIDTEA